MWALHRGGGGVMRISRSFAFNIAAVIFIIDQLVKFYIVQILRLYAWVDGLEITSFFRLTWVENRGVSMGMLTADSNLGRWLLVGMTAAIATAVGVWILRSKDGLERLALGLVLGGALGNILDRIRFGYVVDFVHLHWHEHSFYVFNVADAAITIGVLLLLVRALIPGEDQAR